MNLKEKLKSLLQQGSLYRSQGLAEESLSKYREAIAILEKNEKIKNRESLIEGIRVKMAAVKSELDKFEAADDSPEISSKIQDLIKQQFAFSDDKDAAALEGAIALAKFGQFSRALEEFGLLLDREAIRVDAAKNIVRCHMALSSLDEAVSQYHQWLSLEQFTKMQLSKVRVFFNATLERSGMEDVELPKPGEKPSISEPEAAPEPESEVSGEPTIEMPDLEILDAEPEAEVMEMEEVEDDEILDINSIGFTPESGPKEGKMLELNVSFQSGDVISILIPGRDKDIIEYLQPDMTLENVQFYSPMAIFNGIGKVSTKTKIESGPRRGDYNVDIKVITT